MTIVVGAIVAFLFFSIRADRSSSPIQSASAEETGGTATYIGLHPHAKDQPTVQGRTIGAVAGFNGQVYFGYGDTLNNTGPIMLSSYAPADGEWTDHAILDTERVGRFRTLFGELWAPAWDGRTPGAAYASGSASHVWNQHAINLGPVHVYDALAAGDSRHPLLSGAFGGPSGGAVMRRTPAGWTFSLSVPGEFTRFYNLGQLDGRVYTVLGGVDAATLDLHPTAIRRPGRPGGGPRRSLPGAGGR